MKLLKYTLFIFALTVSLAMTALAQDREGDKKTPPKPNPPVVIVNDKPKENDQDKKGSPNVSFLINLISRND